MHANASYVRRNILHCTYKDCAMLEIITSAITRLFAPAFELLGDMPPRAMTRLFAPF